MKKLLKITLITLALALPASMYAQLLPVSLSIKGGVNQSNVNTDRFKSKTGFNAGLALDVNLPANLALMTGAELTTKGAKSKDADITMNAMYLQVPVHLGYRIGLVPGISAHVDLGPYFAQGIGGKTKIGGEKFNTFSDNDEYSGLKKFDWGLGLGVGVTFISKIQVRAGFDLGMADVGNSDVKVKNRNAYLSVGWVIF